MTWCHGCEREFGELTATIFADHKLSFAGMFYLVHGMETKTIARLTRQLDQTYKTVLEFVHVVPGEARSGEFVLSPIAEADGIYVTAGEQDQPRDRGLKERTWNIRRKQLTRPDSGSA